MLPGGAPERPHLIERAPRGIKRGRVLVVAGACFGKSTFLTQLAASLETDESEARERAELTPELSEDGLTPSGGPRRNRRDFEHRVWG